MSFLDDLLTQDERILLESRGHPLFMVVNSAPYLLGTVVLWIAAVLAILYVPDVADINVGLILGLILLAVSLVPLIAGAYRILHWWRKVYIVTSFRIIQIDGLMHRNTSDSALEKVNDIVTSQSVFGRMFNYGTIKIITGSEAAINEIAGVSRPYIFKRVLMEAKLDYGSRGTSDDDLPGPEAESEQAGGSEADTDPMLRVADEQQQSRAVVALTELRNFGVISDKEFNEKMKRLTGSS